VRRVEQPETIFWGSFLDAGSVDRDRVFSRGLRGCRMDSGYHQGIIFVIATFAGPMLIPILYRPHEGMDLTAYRLSLYPLFALVHGIVAFVQGPVYWGGLLPLWYGHVLLALVMKLVPRWSPLLLGLYLPGDDRRGSVSGKLGKISGLQKVTSVNVEKGRDYPCPSFFFPHLFRKSGAKTRSAPVWSLWAFSQLQTGSRMAYRFLSFSVRAQKNSPIPVWS